MPERRSSKWTDKQRYCMAVLFLHGYSLSEVAALMYRYGLTHRLSRQTVEGVLRRAGIAASMPKPEKQALLDRFKGNRLDGGILAEHVFRVI